MKFSIETARLIIPKFEDLDVDDILKCTTNAEFWLRPNIGWEPTAKGIMNYYLNTAN